MPWRHSVSREILEVPDRTVCLFFCVGLFVWHLVWEEDFHVPSLSSSCGCCARPFHLALVIVHLLCFPANCQLACLAIHLPTSLCLSVYHVYVLIALNLSV